MAYKIVCLDVHAPEVREIVQSVVPEGFYLKMADSYDEEKLGLKFLEFDDLLTTSDIISVHVP